MATPVHNMNHVPFTLNDDAASRFFTDENGRKFVTEMAKLTEAGGKVLIPTSYPRGEWAGMKDNQKQKVLKVWGNLSVEKKEAILSVVNDILATKAVISQQGITNTNTNKNDTIRLIHIYCDPRNAVVFSHATQTFQTRQQLDDSEYRGDSYGMLVDRFNDRSN